MNGFIIFVLGTILLNTIFSMIPKFFYKTEPGVYLPYQAWFNVLLLFNLLLPSRRAEYLYYDEIEKDEKSSTSSESNDNSMNKLPEAIPSAPPDDNEFSPPIDRRPSVPPLPVDDTPGLTTELDSDTPAGQKMPDNYDVYASRAE